MQTKKSILIAFIKSNSKIIFSAFLFGILSIFSSILVPVFIGKYYQIAFHKHSTRGKMFDAVFGHITGIKIFFISFGILIFLKFLFDYLMRYYLGISGELFAKSTRENLFARQMNVKLEEHQKKETGLYLLRYSGDLSAIQNYLTKGIISFTNDCLHFLLGLAVLAIYNLELTLILLASYPVIFISILYLNKKLKILTSKRRNRRSNNLSFVSSRLISLLTIKAFNRQNVEKEKYIKGSTDLFLLGKRYYRLHSFIHALLPFMLYGMLAIILFVAYSLKNEHHKIHAHDLVTFIMTVISLMPVLKRILNVNFVWQSGDVSFTKMLRVFNAKQESSNTSEEKKITRGSITFNNVSFTFYKGDSVFKNLSFSIPDNSLVLISGEHQSGKSTLFKLIMGLYPANEGEIFVGNNNIDNYSKLFLRKKITIVSDEFPLIGKTVFEAISYSRKEENRLPAFKILQKLNYAKENETDSLLDEPIFENGKNLSYSQRKILMFARALLTNKKILLLDEPFEGLDDNLVLILVSILEELKLSNRTILLIDRNRHQQLKYDMKLDLSLQNQ